MELWDRIQRGMEAGFDATIAAVHTLTEKAGEGIELTRLRREKARLETQVTRQLAELGNTVYKRISRDRLDSLSEQLGIKDVLLEIKQNEDRMAEIDHELNTELKNR